MRRSRRCPRSRAASAARGRGRLSGSPRPPVSRDRDELLHCRVELLLPRPPQPLAQDRDDRRPRPPVDEDDEAEAEPLLVGAVEPLKLGQQGLAAAALLRRRLADPRVRGQRLGLLLVRQLAYHLAGDLERILAVSEPLDEARPAREK